MRTSDSYICIALWGRNLGSFNNYIRTEQKIAFESDAPLTAIFQNQDGSWATLETIENTDLRQQLTAKLAVAVTAK